MPKVNSQVAEVAQKESKSADKAQVRKGEEIPRKERINPFRFAERCMFDFKDNQARLSALKDNYKLLQDSSSVSAQQYEPLGSYGGDVTDKVSARLERIEKIKEDIDCLECKVKPIQRLIDDLKAPYILSNSPKAALLRILELYYFGNNLPMAVAFEMDITRRTFFRRRGELVKQAIYYLGL